VVGHQTGGVFQEQELTQVGTKTESNMLIKE